MKSLQIKIFAAVIVTVLAGSTAYYLKGKSAMDSAIPGIIPSSSADSSIPGISEPGFYKSDQYGFSFGYPKEFKVSEFNESGADVILIRDAAANSVFQISVSPFDEPGPITKERILQDIPDMPIINDKEISVGGLKALSFTNKNAALETFEIWFVHGGNLYQISAFPSFVGRLDKILATWKLKA